MNQAELSRKIRDIPRLQNYRNSTKVMTIKGIPIYVEDIVRAALISRSNVLLLGARGKGKTTLEHDILDGIFGGIGTYVRMHPKMDEKELFTRLNLGKFLRGELQDSKQLREVIEAIRNNCIIVDEITRGPGITQNRIFGLADGYFDLDGVRYQIGNGYSILVASGNVGDEYTGTFQLDGALIDRFPVILDLNNFSPRAKDTFLRLIKKHDPRVPKVEKVDQTALLKDIYHEIRQLEASILMAMTVQYLITGLGDCPRRGIEKLIIERAMPECCGGCTRLATGCGYHQGISERTGEAIIGITLALQQVAIAKADAMREAGTPIALNTEDDVSDVLEVFKVFAGNTGILNAQQVRTRYMGSPYLFMTELVAAVKTEFDAKMGDLLRIIDIIKTGGRPTESDLKVFTDEISAGAGSGGAAAVLQNPWRFVRELV